MAGEVQPLRRIPEVDPPSVPAAHLPPTLSHTMCLSVGCRTSTPPKTVNLIFEQVIVNNKLKILWGS